MIRCPTSLGRARKSDLVDVDVVGNRSASSWSVARQDIDSTWGETSFNNQLADAERTQRCLLFSFVCLKTVVILASDHDSIVIASDR